MTPNKPPQHHKELQNTTYDLLNRYVIQKGWISEKKQHAELQLLIRSDSKRDPGKHMHTDTLSTAVPAASLQAPGCSGGSHGERLFHGLPKEN